MITITNQVILPIILIIFTDNVYRQFFNIDILELNFQFHFFLKNPRIAKTTKETFICEILQGNSNNKT